jgi:hypothetical protein
MADQGAEAFDVFAVAVPKVAETFARGVARGVNADVIDVGKPEAMHGERPATDVAADFLEDVVLRAALIGYREQAGAVDGWHANQTYDA